MPQTRCAFRDDVRSVTWPPLTTGREEEEEEEEEEEALAGVTTERTEEDDDDEPSWTRGERELDIVGRAVCRVEGLGRFLLLLPCDDGRYYPGKGRWSRGKVKESERGGRLECWMASSVRVRVGGVVRGGQKMVYRWPVRWVALG